MTATFGNDTIYPNSETLTPGVVRLYKVSATSSGSNGKLSLCVHDDNTGQTFKVGIYQAGVDLEDNLIFNELFTTSETGNDYKDGAVTNVPNLVPHGWHDIAIDGTQGFSYGSGDYWVGVLQPDGDSGDAMTCVQSSGSSESYDSSATGLTSLPHVIASPTNHQTSRGAVSAYGSN